MCNAMLHHINGFCYRHLNASYRNFLLGIRQAQRLFNCVVPFNQVGNSLIFAADFVFEFLNWNAGNLRAYFFVGRAECAFSNCFVDSFIRDLNLAKGLVNSDFRHNCLLLYLINNYIRSPFFMRRPLFFRTAYRLTFSPSFR